MKSGTKAFIANEGGKLVSSLVRLMIARPHKIPPLETIDMPIPHHPEPTVISPPLSSTPTTSTTSQEELDYRWECCMKHLGGASVLLMEAYERAIDEGIGDGTAEKIMEAMNQHSGMEVDLEKMLSIPGAKEQAEKLLSGVRSFRKAAWEARLPNGNGTKEDIADARLWNDILYQEAFTSAKHQPGEECIREGM